MLALAPFRLTGGPRRHHDDQWLPRKAVSVIARKATSAVQRGLFLLPPVESADNREADIARARARLRTWEVRRAFAARVLIALSLPMAYLLLMLSTGAVPPLVAARVVLWPWLATLAVSALCAEAAWRNRVRLEALLDARMNG